MAKDTLLQHGGENGSRHCLMFVHDSKVYTLRGFYICMAELTLEVLPRFRIADSLAGKVGVHGEGMSQRVNAVLGSRFQQLLPVTTHCYLFDHTDAFLEVPEGVIE